MNVIHEINQNIRQFEKHDAIFKMIVSTSKRCFSFIFFYFKRVIRRSDV